MNEILRRRRALMGAQGGELPVLNPSVSYIENTKLNRQIAVPCEEALDGCCATYYFPGGSSGNFVYFIPVSPLANASGICGNVIYNQTGNRMDAIKAYSNCYMNGQEHIGQAVGGTRAYVRINLPMDKLSQCYAYNDATGAVYFAGKDTPYYGKTNIND